jgi:hypothetical protein
MKEILPEDKQNREKLNLNLQQVREKERMQENSNEF